MRPSFYLILFSLFIKPCIGSAQNCPENIDLANKLLEAKEYRKSLELVKICIEPSEGQSVQWQAYRVMAIAYLYIDKMDSAQWACDALLQINPGYVPDKINNPKGLVKLMNKRVVLKPHTFYTNYFAGTTISQVKVTKLYGVTPYSKTYIPLVGGQFGAQFGWYITDKISLDLGATVNANRYAIQYDIPNWKLYYQENQLNIQMPLTAQYLLNGGRRLRYGFRVGVYKQYVITSENSFESTFLPSGELSVLNRELTSDRRNRWFNGYIFGINSLYKIGKGHLNIQASFIKSITPYNKPEARFDETHILYNYFYLDDDINFNNFSFSIGYTHLFHGAVKKYDH
ncbi:MAG: hypothetical protein SGJ00_13470 [bacterium]|nr:hypothetical protein [bacterium]